MTFPSWLAVNLPTSFTVAFFCLRRRHDRDPSDFAVSIAGGSCLRLHHVLAIPIQLEGDRFRSNSVATDPLLFCFYRCLFNFILVGYDILRLCRSEPCHFNFFYGVAVHIAFAIGLVQITPSNTTIFIPGQDLVIGFTHVLAIPIQLEGDGLRSDFAAADPLLRRYICFIDIKPESLSTNK